MLNNKHLLGRVLLVAIASVCFGVNPSAARIGAIAVAPATVSPRPLSDGAALIARLRPRPAGLGTHIPSPGPGAAPDYNVFRSVVVPVGTLPAFGQWASVQPAASGTGAGLCTDDGCATRTGQRLATAAVQAESLQPLAALRLVNSEVNSALRYRADRGDNWQSFAESAARGAGDCEDFAIAKMTMLRSAGFALEQLQFIVLKDARKQLYHAVLAVHVEGKRYILDNLSNAVVADTSYRSYVPIASFIGSRTFIHGFTGNSTAAAALGPEGFAGVRPGEGR